MKTIIAGIIAAAALVGNTSPSASDALTMVMNAVGNDCERVQIAQVSADECYSLGLCEDDFSSVISAAMTIENDADGSAKAVIITDGKKSAKALFEKMWKNYEFAACDNAKRIVFICSGSAVAYFKGDTENVDAYSRAFGDLFGIKGLKIIKNTAKYDKGY